MGFLNRSDTNQAVQSGFKKKRKCTICVAKTKALISFAVNAKLICVFVFAYADCWFSHEAAQMSTTDRVCCCNANYHTRSFFALSF